MEALSVRGDYVVIALSAFFLGIWLGYKLTQGGISSLKLLETKKQ